jgi:hypothetical protein
MRGSPVVFEKNNFTVQYAKREKDQDLYSRLKHEVITPTLRLGPFKTGFSLFLKFLFFVIIKTITKNLRIQKVNDSS